MTAPHSCVIQAFTVSPSNDRGVTILVLVGRGGPRLGTTRKSSAGHCSAGRKHHFAYCCVIAGTCCEVTVLAWRKFATICSRVQICLNDNKNSKFGFFGDLEQIGALCYHFVQNLFLLACLWYPTVPGIGRLLTDEPSGCRSVPVSVELMGKVSFRPPHS
jgi:hypothetical protein